MRCRPFHIVRPLHPPLVVTNSVADGASHSKHAVAVELDIVLDVIVVNFRTHEEVVPHVIANAGAEMLHEVIATGVVNTAAAEIAAGSNLWNIKSSGGNADTAHQIQADFLGDFRLIERVEIGEDGTISFILAGIDSLTCLPGGFNVEPEMMFETGDIAAEANVSAALFRGRLEK